MAQPVVVHPLEPLGEDWQRGLAIVAHPDDLEFGAAAAIARWTGQGKQIVYCLVTSGEAGIDTMAPSAGPARPRGGAARGGCCGRRDGGGVPGPAGRHRRVRRAATARAGAGRSADTSRRS